MKDILLVCLIFLLHFVLLSNYTIAQEGWFPINKSAGGNHLKSIYFINDSTGYTVSNEGNLFITNDRGNNWSHIKLSDNSLNDIFFFGSTGFIVGENGTIFKKEENQSWIEKNSGTNNKLNAVYFIDADTGYAFGDNSTIIKTTNGGDNWEKLIIIQELTITDGAFPMPEFGLCTSMEGILISTQDYGRSWQYLSFPEDNLFYSIFFPDTAVAYITAWGGDLDYILKLTNRGNEWKVKWPETLSNINSSFFHNADTGYIVGSNGLISKTTDGGNTWNHQKSFTSKNLYDVFFLNEEYGYVCGDDKTIIKTTDGGLTWDIKSSGNSTDLWDIYFIDENIGFIAGETDCILKTTDAGNNWNISDSIFDGWLSSVYFINSDTGFCSSMLGNFFTTTDGGITWSKKNFYDQGIDYIMSISFFDEDVGFISGNKILKTTNSGQNWFVVNQNSSWDISFINKNTIISVGPDGSIYKSIDNGNNWNKKVSGTNKILTSTVFLNENNGYAVGWDGIILRTNDGGETWSNIFSSTNTILWDIKFISNDLGYIVGDYGTVLYTENTGIDWSFQNSGTNEDLHSIFFTDLKIGYIAGTSGTILKTINGGITSIEKPDTILPLSINLLQNFPNPFNPFTKIKFEITEGDFVTIKIYNMLGREVATLLKEELKLGTYSIDFDGRNLSSGIYLCVLNTSKNSAVIKMALLK